VNGQAQTLILAWGNPARLDDGLGPELARIAAGWELSDVTIDSGYQLQVEDAQQAAEFRRVVFVDADRIGPGPFRVERLRAGKSGIGFSSHSVSPASLLALSRDLFGSEPEAWLVGIRGYEFDEFGERLSVGARDNLEATAGFVRAALDADAFREIGSETSHD